ncbi:MAG: type II toxin-antitoxin system RelE/ParE family toxin [Oscillospiraceae bacterium]|nr:type II toxin-antitoxin system RelE/ParE family toxin [Oscillospiraceae bacterium]
MIYEVQLTDEAKLDLRGIYEYIAYSLLEPMIAKIVKNRIVSGLKPLDKIPERYPIYQEEPWKNRGLRRINIGNYSGFFLIAEKSVRVIRILYGGRDIRTILNESE